MPSLLWCHLTHDYGNQQWTKLYLYGPVYPLPIPPLSNSNVKTPIMKGNFGQKIYYYHLSSAVSIFLKTKSAFFYSWNTITAIIMTFRDSLPKTTFPGTILAFRDYLPKNDVTPLLSLVPAPNTFSKAHLTSYPFVSGGWSSPGTLHREKRLIVRTTYNWAFLYVRRFLVMTSACERSWAWDKKYGLTYSLSYSSTSRERIRG